MFRIYAWLDCAGASVPAQPQHNLKNQECKVHTWPVKTKKETNSSIPSLRWKLLCLCRSLANWLAG